MLMTAVKLMPQKMTIEQAKEILLQGFRGAYKLELLQSNSFRVDLYRDAFKQLYFQIEDRERELFVFYCRVSGVLSPDIENAEEFASSGV